YPRESFRDPGRGHTEPPASARMFELAVPRRAAHRFSGRRSGASTLGRTICDRSTLEIHGGAPGTAIGIAGRAFLLRRPQRRMVPLGGRSASAPEDPQPAARVRPYARPNRASAYRERGSVQHAQDLWRPLARHRIFAVADLFPFQSFSPNSAPPSSNPDAN